MGGGGGGGVTEGQKIGFGGNGEDRVVIFRPQFGRKCAGS